MRGGLLLNTQRIGKRYRSICVVSILFLLLCACKRVDSSYDERRGYDDFAIHLVNNYYIAESNSHSVHLCRENDDLLLFAIKYFYVRHYIVTDDYIYLEGICTERWERATDEELEANKLSYYSVCLETDEIFGPFETYDEFVSFCNIDFEHCDLQWTEPTDYEPAY